MTRFGSDLIQSANQAFAIAKGELDAPRRIAPETIDVASIRKKLGLSQAKFAARFGLSAATVRDWEQHRRRPDRVARTLLAVIDTNPEAVDQALTG